MIPNVTFKAHYSAPPQAKEFLTYLLTNHPTSNAVGIKVELVAIKWKKINGDCTGTPFMGGVYNSIRISVGTKDRPRSTPHILRTLAHEYKHVLQNDISIGNEPARCVEANAFANKVVPLFLFQLQSSSGKIQGHHIYSLTWEVVYGVEATHLTKSPKKAKKVREVPLLTSPHQTTNRHAATAGGG